MKTPGAFKSWPCLLIGSTGTDNGRFTIGGAPLLVRIRDFLLPMMIKRRLAFHRLLRDD
jgi:hypothetical protein